MATQMAEMTTTQTTKKSGKGISDGVVSELTAIFGVLPGHAEELRAACQRNSQALRDIDPRGIQKTGLRDSRHVLFDGDTRLLWTTTFETDWDPYLDDALLVIGPDVFIDWMQHTTEAEQLSAWMRSVGGREELKQVAAGATTDDLGLKSAGLKRIIQSVQVQGTAYFNAIADTTMPQISKAARVEQAFQQVLDGPDAADALAHPGLAPLLEQAAD